MNREMRVGIVVFLAIAFLGGLVFVSGGVRFKQYGYSFGIVFPDAMGLDAGAPVLVSGVESGRVNSIALMDKGVLVSVSVKGHVIIPSDSKFQIDTGGLLGEPRVKITRGPSFTSISPDDVVPGTIPPAFDEILEDIRRSLGDVQNTFSNINSFLGKLSDAADDFQGFSNEARGQLKRVGDSIVRLTGNLDSVVEENRESLSLSLNTLSEVMGKLRAVVSQFDEDGMSGRDVRETVVRIGEAARNVGELTRKIEDTFFKEGEAPGKNTISDIREIVGKANRIISDIEDIHFDGTVSVHGVTQGPRDSDVMADVSLWTGSRSRKIGLLLGAEDIGSDPGVSAAIGYSGEMFRFWAGSVRGYPGVGFMLFPLHGAGGFSIGGQWWDQQNGRWSIDGRYSIGDSWGVFYRYLDLDDGHRDSAGVFYRF
ncbi:MAG TPA: MlaD family protein [Synergistales bacterium]|nr:MlaD family protein [Synergistales bacterium]HRV70583.1 MlaD family protein [Thermovirgaceae bacterium]